MISFLMENKMGNGVWVRPCVHRDVVDISSCFLVSMRRGEMPWL